jgi:hypothetical protein
LTSSHSSLALIAPSCYFSTPCCWKPPGNKLILSFWMSLLVPWGQWWWHSDWGLFWPWHKSCTSMLISAHLKRHILFPFCRHLFNVCNIGKHIYINSVTFYHYQIISHKGSIPLKGNKHEFVFGKFYSNLHEKCLF